MPSNHTPSAQVGRPAARRGPGTGSADRGASAPDPVLLSTADAGVLTLTLNRPKTLNALNTELVQRLTEAVRAAGEEIGIRALIITGAGRAFCSGQDLAEHEAEGGGKTVRDRLERLYIPLIQAIRACPRPVIAAVNGPAAGAGASLALACDLIYLARGAVLVEAFTQIGLVPDCGSTFFLTRTLGMARALEILWSGRPVAADEAVQLGLVNDVIAPDELLSRVEATARSLAAGPTRALSLIKATVKRAAELSLDEVLALETEAQVEAAATRDHRQALAAFFRKEKPSFEGR